MTYLDIASRMAAAVLLLSAMAHSQKVSFEGQGQAIVTVLPAHPAEQDASVTMGQLQVKVAGKDASVTGWTPLKGADSRLELVFLIDGSARSSLGGQLSDVANFAKEIPSNAKFAVAYMQGGNAVLASPLSADPAPALRALHLPSGPAGSNGSPYFCLSDLSKHWPSQDRGARRAVVMITDGVDEYQQRFDPNDPYVQTAITDSVRAGVVVYSMYWDDQGRASSSDYETGAGQNLIAEVTQATGGNSYWQGDSNPISFQPYFEDLRSRLRNQYALSFAAARTGKPGVETLKLKASAPGAKVTAPQLVFVNRPSESAQ
jgi:hypothetical protein